MYIQGHSAAGALALGAETDAQKQNIATMRKIADGINRPDVPATMNAKAAGEILQDALRAHQTLLDATTKLRNTGVTGLVLSDAIATLEESTISDRDQFAKPMVAQVIAGKKTGVIQTRPFAQNLSRFLGGIARTWESLDYLEDMPRPALLILADAMPKTMALFSSIGQGWLATVKFFGDLARGARDAAAAAGRGLGVLADIAKWSAIGGGLYLLWKYALKK